MTVVAGIDFGTASVRVSIFESELGRLASGVAEYPVLRCQEAPLLATQAPEDQFSALGLAFQTALERRHRGTCG